MQVRPETAHLLGHRGSVQALFEPETNVRLGVTYLSRAWELAKGDLCRALMKYRAGHGEEQMTALVEYCRRALQPLGFHRVAPGPRAASSGVRRGWRPAGSS